MTTRCLQLAVLFVLFSLNNFRAQTLNRTEMEDQAYMYFNAGDYANAYKVFDQLSAKYPKEYDYKQKLGLCCLYYPDKNARAIEIFRELQKDFPGPSNDYYLGKAYQVNYKFDEALGVLEPLVEALSPSKKEEDKALVADAKLGIINCENGKYLVQNKVIADIENIGSPINTSELEAVPVITADESLMIFTYSGAKSLGGKVNESLKPDPNGHYGQDVYKSMRNADGTWGTPEPITSINTEGNDAAIALSPDGQNLFTFRSDNKNSGDIFVSRLQNNEFSKPEPLNANINTPDYWEGSCSVSADGKYLYFSSERPGGSGGRDIWVSEMVNGDWGPAVNLGPKVNTSYDDDAPFIHPDGITMFFSSKGHKSIGGYDIMFTIKEDQGWTEPKSMGIPLNTTGDDNFYVLNSKGDRGYFSSYRSGPNSKGERDIYTVTPGILGEKPVIGLIKGTVYGNDKPIGATIEVLKNGSDKVGPYASDRTSGKYLMAFSPGATYDVKVSAEGFAGSEEKIDLKSLSAYTEKTVDFRLYSAEVMAARKAAEEAKADSLRKATAAAEPVKPQEPEVTKAAGETPPATSAAETKKEETAGTTPASEEKSKAEPVKGKTKKSKKPDGSDNDSENKEGTAKNSGCSEILPDLAPLKSKSLNDPSYYSQLLELAGNYCSKGLVFRVQIGAYRLPEEFEKHNNLKSLGKIDSEKYPDGLTRFTQKEFNTLNDAEKHRRKVIAKGQTDAWIVGFKEGKRYTLEDLIMIDFLGKTIN